MKNLLKYLALALLVLVAVLLFNTLRINSKQMTGLAPIAKLSLSDSIINHLAEAVQLRTVSYEDPANMDSLQFEKFIQFVAKTYPLTHSKLTLERVNNYALFFEWKGKNTALKPALLMGHYDVVPIIQGTERIWQHKPFAGEIAEGYLFGRGTMDDKSTVVGIFEAVEYLLKTGYQPERTFYLSFGHDEEVSGKNGAQYIANLCEKRKLEFEYVIDEGGMIKVDGLAGITKPIAFVGIAEKGFLTLQLNVTSEGGHSSMPPPQTGIGMLAEAIDKVQKNPFEGRIEGAAGHMQDYLAPEMPFSSKLAMANRWLFKPLLINSIGKTSAGNATLRTTIAPTIFEAGVKDNVLPIEAMAKINFRILPGDTLGTVINHVKKAINNEKVVIERMGTHDPNPSAVSDTAAFGFRLIQSTITRCFPDVIVAPNLVVGATDSRFFKNVSKNIYRFMPVRLKDEDLKRVHGTNERISVEDFKNVVQFYVEIVKGS
jgi:carboxypeptidase PM20D1